jgi:hypothetical protein
VPATPVLGIEGLGVAAVQELHPGRELRPPALDDQVVVVAHQAEGVHAPAEALDDEAEQAEEEQPILVVQIDVAAGDPARRHVVDAVGQLGAGQTRHRRRG